MLRMMRQFALVGLAAVITLAGCASPGPEPSASETGEPSGSPAPSATASPTPTPEQLTLAECEVMLPIQEARALFADDTEFLGEPAAEFRGLFPIAEVDSTLADASRMEACSWGVPNSDGVFTIHAVEVTPEQRSSLEAALTAAGFSMETEGPVTRYEMTGENAVSTTAATHLFTGDVWIMCNSTDLGTTGPAADAALEALRTANPTLGL